MDIYIQYILAFFGVIAMAGVAFAQFKKGFRTESGDLITFYQKEALGYKEMMETTRKDYAKKHEELLAQVGELRGELNAEKRLREQYELILKDRNPETEEFMRFMVQSAKDQADNNKKIVEVLNIIHIAVAKDLKIEATVSQK